MIVSLIEQITGGADDLHIIMCYKTVDNKFVCENQSDIQNKTRLNSITYFNPPISLPSLISHPLKVP